jgi:hypothetical protein
MLIADPTGRVGEGNPGYELAGPFPLAGTVRTISVLTPMVLTGRLYKPITVLSFIIFPSFWRNLKQGRQ